MASSLESLLAEGVISEIYGRLKSGKEADVYAVCYGDGVVAAKVYKDRAQRSFKSNATYKEGRAVRNTRSQRAMDRGSKFGQEAAEDAWKASEATALDKLHGAGVRVPTPVLFLEGVLFMELVRGHDGEPAPRLIDTELTPEQARAAYMDMLAQLVRILSCDLIHGDLSPYNVLWAAGGATIIDFPQIVSAAQNSNSESFFVRDARNILGYFAEIDRSLQARLGSDTREIWRAYLRRELTPDFLPSGRPPPAEPRRFSDQDRRPQQQREPRPQLEQREQRAQQQNREPRPQSSSDGRARQHSNGRTGARPQTSGGQHHSGQGAPRLQMASARANIASQSGDNGGRFADNADRPNNGGRFADNAARPNNGGRFADNAAGPNNGGRFADNAARPNNGGRFADNAARPNNGGRPNNGDRPNNGGRPNGNDGARPNGGGRPNNGGRSNGGGARPNNGGRSNASNAERNAGRRPTRGPEVIVLTRRAPEGGANRVEPQPAPQAAPPADVERTDQDSRRRRGR